MDPAQSGRHVLLRDLESHAQHWLRQLRQGLELSGTHQQALETSTRELQARAQQAGLRDVAQQLSECGFVACGNPPDGQELERCLESVERMLEPIRREYGAEPQAPDTALGAAPIAVNAGAGPVAPTDAAAVARPDPPPVSPGASAIPAALPRTVGEAPARPAQSLHHRLVPKLNLKVKEKLQRPVETGLEPPRPPAEPVQQPSLQPNQTSRPEPPPPSPALPEFRPLPARPTTPEIERTVEAEGPAPEVRAARPARAAPGWLLERWWWVALTLLGLIGLLVVLIVTLSGDEEPEPENATSALAAVPTPPVIRSPPGTGVDTGSGELPSVLAQLRQQGGKESPELAQVIDLMGEEAQRAVRQACSAPDSAECAKARELFSTPSEAGTPIPRRAKNPDLLRPRWLHGLKLPDFPVSEDPHVEAQLQAFTRRPQGREDFKTLLFRCGKYKALIETALKREELPTDLVAVVLTESNCSPTALSPAGARGLWQMMPAAARGYHLQVEEGIIDERLSPSRSTEAAVRFLGDLFRKFGSWDLALAAYNMGPFGLMTRMRRAGGADVGYWDLVDADLLPEETSKYVPRIQAFALIARNLRSFQLHTAPTGAAENTSPLEVPPGTRLGVVARAAQTSLERIRKLNLQLLGDRVPTLPGVQPIVQVPAEVLWDAQSALPELIQSAEDQDLCVGAKFDWGQERFTDEMAKSCKRSRGTPTAAAPLPGAKR